MAKPTTIRIPEDLLNEINEFIQELNLDRLAYLREVLRKGFSMDKQDRLLLKYVRKELSQMEVCKELNWDPWEFLTQLKCPWHFGSSLSQFFCSANRFYMFSIIYIIHYAPVSLFFLRVFS